jgi:hypothetical protein
MLKNDIKKNIQIPYVDLPKVGYSFTAVYFLVLSVVKLYCVNCNTCSTFFWNLHKTILNLTIIILFSDLTIILILFSDTTIILILFSDITIILILFSDTTIILICVPVAKCQLIATHNVLMYTICLILPGVLIYDNLNSLSIDTNKENFDKPLISRSCLYAIYKQPAINLGLSKFSKVYTRR